MAGQQRPHTSHSPHPPQPQYSQHSWRGQVITSGALDELDDVTPTMPQLPSVPRIPVSPSIQATQAPERPQGKHASVHDGPPLSGAALEMVANYADYMLTRLPSQVLSSRALAALAPDDLRRVRATMRRIYNSALRLAGRATYDA